VELLPAKATFAPGEPIVVEGRGVDGTVGLVHLDRLVAEARVDGGRVSFPPQPEGGYGIDADGASTAVDVLADPLSRPRYGFVSHYEAGRATDGVAENVRRFHLSVVQFYDWMYRHAKLMPPTEEFEDALGQHVSLATVRRLVAAVRRSGSLPMAYAAVYAVGAEAWPDWEADGLFRRDGSPWMLGDFLWNVDPTSERWLAHFTGELRSTLDVGFAGFHLDQYGSPKWALRRDGTRVDLVEAFPALIDRVAVDVPESRNIFNNVNDFPTFATVHANQALTYIEVWAPHTTLAHLAELVTKARLLAPDRAVVLAAYLSAYQGDEGAALQAEKLQLATVFSHGGTVLLHGEESAVLTEAYYVMHKEITWATQDVSRRYFDLAVRYGDLLFAAEDVTRTHLGGENEEVRVEASAPVSTDAEAGTLWGRVLRVSGGLLVSLIDLSAQADETWDAPKTPSAPLDGVRLSILRGSEDAARFAIASPAAPQLVALEPARSERYDTAELPAFDTWALVLIRDGAA
jgi:dextranase